jgi:hypothetical protein
MNKCPDGHRISVKNVWMVESKTRLLPQFEKRDILPLRGLFWFSKVPMINSSKPRQHQTEFPRSWTLSNRNLTHTLSLFLHARPLRP